MNKPFIRDIVSGVVSFVLTVSVISAQEHEHPPSPTTFNDTIAYIPEALGPFTRPISTKSKEAQAYFDQGFQLRYAFGVTDAARSFRQAQKHDSNNAMCYWGEAWAWGSFLNRKMSKVNAPHAYTAIQKAVKLSKNHTSPVEKALIKAMSIRYVKNFDPATQAVQDTAYAEAMHTVYESFPNDLDVATLYAEALFLLEPRRGTRDIHDPDVERLHRVLEKVLAVDLRHPGAGHLYIHATESTSQPEKALAVAEILGNLIPGASHMNHMPSHTFNEVGLWGKGVRANIQAWHTDQKAKQGKAFAIYAGHNLQMLLYAASYDGQGAIAIQAARDEAKNTGNTMFFALTLIRFGRFDEVLQVQSRPENTISGGLWDFAHGYAHLRTGEADFAQGYLDRVLAAADSSKKKLRVHSAKHLLGTVGGILEGEIHREAGDLDAAIMSFKRAVALEDAMMYDEPEPLPFSARHWLGAALLEAKQFEAAEHVYREELDDHPHNGWSLFGLKTALDAQKKSVADVEEAFHNSWSRSEVWIQASRF